MSKYLGKHTKRTAVVTLAILIAIAMLLGGLISSAFILNTNEPVIIAPGGDEHSYEEIIAEPVE